MLNYQILGQGEPIVLIHGLFGSLENLNMVAKPLSEHFQTIAVDARNHGASPHCASMHYDEMASDIIQLLDHLNLGKVHLLGHSMGGKIAMATALKYPKRVHSLIAADIAPVDYTPSHLQIIDGLKSVDLANTTSRTQADKQLAHYVKELGVRQFLLKNLVIENNSASWRCNLAHISDNYRHLIAGLTSSTVYPGPTLFIKGGNSNYLLAEHQAIIQQLFSNTSAKIIQGAGHWLHAEKPVAFNKIVSDFIQRHPLTE